MAEPLPDEIVEALADQHDLEQIQIAMARKIVRGSLYQFVKTLWPVVRPNVVYKDNWHIKLICEELEKVSHPELHNVPRTKREVINVPPGSAKSLLVCVFWPTWVWCTKSWFQFIFVTYQKNLTLRDATISKQLMETKEYREFVDTTQAWDWDPDQNTKEFYKNTRGGYRISLSVDGAGTGYRANAVVFDDPVNVPKSGSPTLEQVMVVNDWWDQRMGTRLNDPAEDTFLGIMQRLHELDLTGWLLARDEREQKAGNPEWIPYRHISIPAEYNLDEPNDYDPRRTKGELFFPSRFTQAVLNAYKITLGEFGYAAQFQQNPFPTGGGIFNISKLKLWVLPGMKVPAYQLKDREGNTVSLEILELPSDMGYQCQSWDCSFKDLESSDPVCGQVWGYEDAKFWMLDMVMGQMGVTRTMAEIRAMTIKWPEAFSKYVEDKANGPAVVEMLQECIIGLEAVDPRGGKETRAQAVVPFVDAGNVVLPHPVMFHLGGIAPAVNMTEELIAQMARFPKGGNDDGVDAMTQALNKMGLMQGDYLEAMIRKFHPLAAGYR